MTDRLLKWVDAKNKQLFPNGLRKEKTTQI